MRTAKEGRKGEMTHSEKSGAGKMEVTEGEREREKRKNSRKELKP